MPRFLLRLAVLGCLGLAASGCSYFDKDHILKYDFNPRFSVNVASVSENWPRRPESVLKMTSAEQEVMDTLGKPDYVHLWWDKRKPIVDTSQVYARKTAMSGKFHPLKVSWIYSEKRQEVVFKGPSVFETQPLGDKLRILCEQGDPERTQQFPNASGKRVEKWTYYTEGLLFGFEDDVKVLEDRTSIPAVPGYRNY